MSIFDTLTEIMDNTIYIQTRVCENFIQKNSVLDRAPRYLSESQKKAKESIKIQQKALDALNLIDKEIRLHVKSNQAKSIQVYLAKGIVTDHLMIPHVNAEYRTLLRGLHTRIISSFDSKIKRASR